MAHKTADNWSKCQDVPETGRMEVDNEGVQFCHFLAHVVL